MVKICAWTSAHKTVLTSASGLMHLPRNLNTGQDRRVQRSSGKDDNVKQGVMDDEGAAQAGEWF
jgi:hypothetical protein